MEISWWQAWLLFITVPLSTLSTYAPVATWKGTASRDVWIVVALGIVGVAAGLFVVYWYSLRFRGDTIYDSVRKTFGRHVGFVISLCVLGLFLYWSALTLKQFAYYFSGPIYFEMPPIIFIILLACIALMGSAEGIEFISRVNELAALLLVFGIFFFIIFTNHLTEFGYIMPILSDGWSTVIERFPVALAVFGESVWVGMLAMPYINELKQAKKAIWWTAGSLLLISTLTHVWIIALFDEELLSILAVPSLSVARLISIGPVFERIEWINIVMLMSAMAVKLSLLFYGCRLFLSTYVPKLNRTVAATIVSAAAVILSLFVLDTVLEVIAFFESEQFIITAYLLQIVPIVVLIFAALRGVTR